jgi:lysophospholipase L1-like esterase
MPEYSPCTLDYPIVPDGPGPPSIPQKRFPLSDRRTAPAFIASCLDFLIRAYLVLLITWGITGGIKLDLGPLALSATKASSLLRVLVPLLLVRWLLASRLSWPGFALGTGFKAFLMRALEAGILLQLVLVPVVQHRGTFQTSYFRSPNLGQSVEVIFLMLLLHFILGRNRRGILVLVSMTFTLLAAFAGLEILLRITQPDPGTAMAAEIDTSAIPNDKVQWTWGKPITNNSFGFREKEFAVPKPDGRFRIMLLGDSLTWGVGLAPDERYSAILDSLLADRFPLVDLEVLNFGISGLSTTMERDLLVRLEDEVKPDLIVVGFCHNDPQPRGQNYSVEREQLLGFYGLIARLRQVGFERSYAYLIGRIDHTLGRMNAIPTWQEALDRTYAVDSDEWQDFLGALEDIRRKSRERHLPAPVFMVLTMNTARDHPSPPWEAKWFAQAASAAEARGFLVVDPTHRFVEELDLTDLPVNKWDSHPSAAANRLYGETLFEALVPHLETTWTAGGDGSNP